MKTFQVKGSKGEMLEAEQLSTFAYYIQGVQYRFVVTQLSGFPPAVTHRASGMRVTELSILTLRRDIESAARTSLNTLIDRHGEARVASKLREKEHA